MQTRDQPRIDYWVLGDTGEKVYKEENSKMDGIILEELNVVEEINFALSIYDPDELSASG